MSRGRRAGTGPLGPSGHAAVRTPRRRPGPAAPDRDGAGAGRRRLHLGRHAGRPGALGRLPHARVPARPQGPRLAARQFHPGFIYRRAWPAVDRHVAGRPGHVRPRARTLRALSGRPERHQPQRRHRHQRRCPGRHLDRHRRRPRLSRSGQRRHHALSPRAPAPRQPARQPHPRAGDGARRQLVDRQHVRPGAAPRRALRGGALDGLRTNMILSITEAMPGRWWLATYGGGVADYAPASGALRELHHDPLAPTSLGHDRVAALLRDRSGLLWVSTERSLDRHDPATRAVRTVFGGVGLPEANVTAMLPHSDGRLWIALADQGIDIVEADGRRRAALRPDPAHPADALPSRVVFALAEADGGDVWIGTQLGLYRADRAAHRVRRVPLPAHNPYPRIARILPEGDHVWLATAEGLLRYTPADGQLRAYVQGGAASGGLSDN